MKKNLLIEKNLNSYHRVFLTSAFYFLFSILYLLTSSFLSTNSAHAQAGQWAWMKGCTMAGCNATWGTQGIPAATNTPEGVYAPYYWVDAQKNLWVYGGVGTSGSYNALWKFDPVQSEWTWMQGSNSPNQPPVYGTQGVFAASNTPGYRSYSAFSWTDNNGKFWLYGGDATNGTMSDLWEYDPLLNQWAWIAGSAGPVPPNYGTQGIPAATNTPGARREGNASWVDSSNNLWMFGGQQPGGNFYNDMWEFDVSLNQWVWMAGTSSLNAPGIYGTLGVADPSNVPGGRAAYCKWQDKFGNFWLFGGGNAYNENYNDLWMYDPSTNYFTWMSGTSNGNTAANAGAICDSSTSFYPASRFENRSCAVDSCGNFWLFGGLFQTSYSETINDLWVYRPSQNDWTYVSGQLTYNNSGVYGTLGVPDPNNFPGSRMGSVMWIDLLGNVWLFCGSTSWGVNTYNDVWKFIPDPDCLAIGNCMNSSPVAFNASDKTICEKFCINFYDSSANNPTSWFWIFPGGAPSTSTDQNPANICYDVPGVYDVTLITTNANGTDSLTLHNYVTVYATPPFPSITQVGYTLTSSPAISYQWQFNSVDISGATNQSYTILQTGYYTVIVGDSNGCKNSFTTYILISGVVDVGDAGISIYPNPSGGNFMVELLNGPDLAGMAGEVSIDVVNTLGQKVFSSAGTHSERIEINLSDRTAGIYFIQLKANNFIFQQKILISRN